MDKEYTCQIQHYTHRFTMRSMTYEEPFIDFDKAARIIEQVYVDLELLEIIVDTINLEIT